MNKLNELIQQFCPDGVEYKTLGEIATDIYRGSGIKREQVTVSGIPCVRYGEIYTTYGIWFDKCVSHTDVSLISGPKYFEHGDILFAITGESVEDIAKSCAYVGHEKCLAGGDIVVLKHAQNPKYLAYALSTLPTPTRASRKRPAGYRTVTRRRRSSGIPVSRRTSGCWIRNASTTTRCRSSTNIPSLRRRARRTTTATM